MRARQGHGLKPLIESEAFVARLKPCSCYKALLASISRGFRCGWKRLLQAFAPELCRSLWRLLVPRANRVEGIASNWHGVAPDSAPAPRAQRRAVPI